MDVFQQIKNIPELNFILLCACIEPDKIRQNMIKNAADTNPDWHKIYEISQNQRILPLLYKNIKTIISDKVPRGIYNKLKSHSFHNGTRNLYMFGLLLNILALFKEHDIVVIPFKGPVLAHDIYGDIGLRIFSDLDILVSKKTALRAWQLLIHNGFNPELELNSNQILKYIDVEDNISFFKTDKNINVELHWEMSGIYLFKPLMLEHIEKQLNTVMISKRAVPNLSSEDLLLYLCIHGAKHGWEYLELVCCVSELLKTKKNINWNLIEQLSYKWRCKNILYLGLYLSKTLLDAPVPESIYSKIRATKRVIVLAREVIQDMFKDSFYFETTYQAGRFSNFHLKIKDTFYDRIRYFFKLIFRPTKKEWLYYPVPAYLSCLHYFLRPFRLITAGLKGKNA